MATPDQRTIAETYRDAGAEHVAAASKLYDEGRYVQANYLAGLAVECILRSYRVMLDPEFDSRHDISHLYKLARFADIVPPSQEETIGAALGQVFALWANDHRFLSEAALRRRWTKRKLYDGVKGDFVKEQNRRLINAATTIVNVGVARWKTSFKN